MATRNLITVNNYFFQDDETVIIDMNITPSQISFKLVVNYSNYPQVFDTEAEKVLEKVNNTQIIYDYILPIASIKQAKRFNTNTLFGVSITQHQNDGTGTLQSNSLVNISEITKPLRITNPFSGKLVFGNTTAPVLQILVKDTNGTFEDWDLFVFSSSGTTINSNITFTKSTDFLNIIDYLDIISVSKDTSYTSADYTQYTVSTQPYIDEVYLEQVTGLINKSRVKIDNTGKGTFKVLNSSVDSEGIAVRLGFASYTGLTKFTDTL
jgi:hypothetical protein